MASLGGEDDNTVILWDLEKGAALCGATVSKDSSGVTLALAFLNNSETKFVTGGDATLRIWEYDPVQRKIKATDCQTGQIKRIVKCIAVDQKDDFVYCGTTTGDLLQVNLQNGLFKQAGPPKDKVTFFILSIRTTLEQAFFV